MDDTTDNPTPEPTDTSAEAESDPLPSEHDLQDADNEQAYDDGSIPDADSMTTFLPHGLRLN